ncbi:MAG: chemotaxis protein CheW [Gemmatimonadota bacterium]
MQALAFRTSLGLCALPSENVREITTSGAFTRLPGAAPWVRGIINVRGALVTVVDIGHRLGGQPSISAEASVIVAHSEGRTLGLLVDEVAEVIEVEGGGQGPRRDSTRDLVAGVGHFGETVVIVIDAQELVRQTLA